MQLLAFIILYPIIWLISILPFPIFYALSDVIYFFIYRVFKYRKRTVRRNLVLALPHLSDEERKIIEQKFFAHMCDMFLEMVKTMSISRTEIDKRFKFTNIEVFQNLEKQNKNIAVMIAHYASYEWVISLNRFTTFASYAIYKKVNNPYFDKLVRKIRYKFKANLITTSETVPKMEENAGKGILSVYGFASDQSPRLFAQQYWSDFMGINVPVYDGAETLARKFDMNIIFLRTKKVRRGHYEATFEVLTENIEAEPQHSMTDKFLRLVENQIYEQPEFYLWTHKRWKHAGKNPNLQTTN